MTHASKRFLRNHFDLGPKMVKRQSDIRLIIHVVGLHCSSDGKLPKAYNGRLDVTTFQLASKNSHAKALIPTKIIIHMMTKLIIVLNKFENKFLPIF